MVPHRKNRKFGTLVALAAIVTVVAACVWFVLMRPGQLEQARADAAIGQQHSAVRHYLSYLGNSPEDHAARLELAEFLKPINAAMSLRHLQQIPAAAPEYSDAIWHISHIAVVSQQDDLAEDSLLKLDKVRPNDAGVALNLAELYFRTQRFSESLSWVEQATSLQPERAQTWLLFAEVLDYLKRPAEMTLPLRKAIELDSELYEAHANLAYALHYSGELQEAETEARWCLDRRPRDIRVRRWLAMIHRDRGEHDEALKQIRLAIAESRTDVDCRIVEADLLLFTRDADAAYNALIPLYADCSNRRDYLSSLARAAAMSGRREESHLYQQEIVNLIDGLSDQAPPESSVEEAP